MLTTQTQTLFRVVVGHGYWALFFKKSCAAVYGHVGRKLIDNKEVVQETATCYIVSVIPLKFSPMLAVGWVFF